MARDRGEGGLLAGVAVQVADGGGDGGVRARAVGSGAGEDGGHAAILAPVRRQGHPILAAARARGQSTLAPDSLAIFAQRTISLLTNFVKSATVSPPGAAPCAAQ